MGFSYSPLHKILLSDCWQNLTKLAPGGTQIQTHRGIELHSVAVWLWVIIRAPSSFFILRLVQMYQICDETVVIVIATWKYSTYFQFAASSIPGLSRKISLPWFSTFDFFSETSWNWALPKVPSSSPTARKENVIERKCSIHFSLLPLSVTRILWHSANNVARLIVQI